jgi:DUF4097 and DUF4098 domain-containing protein YvlB
MKTTFGSLLLVISFAACAAAQPSELRFPDPPPPLPQLPQPPQAGDSATQRVTMAFSDPAKPGTVEVDVVTGNITIRGTSRRDVQIEAHATPGRPAPRRRADDEPPPPGLRRLTQNSPFNVEEDRNTISIDVDSPVRGMDFTIEVPLRTNLAIETVSGSITVEGVEGELEVEAVNGPVTLTNVGGSVVAHSVNGKVTATVTRAAPQQPMAFTSLNGAVDVTLPAAIKANLKLRSDQGDVYTDFDLQLRQESSNSNPNPNPRVDRSRNGGRDVVDIDNAIYGSVNGGGPDFEMRTFNGNVYVRKAK